VLRSPKSATIQIDLVSCRIPLKPETCSLMPHVTSKLAIIIMSSCSKLWQWKT